MPQSRRSWMRARTGVTPNTRGGHTIETRALEVTYGRGTHAIYALRGIDLVIPSGQFVALQGQSGSGKSTLLHALAALREPSAGSARVHGREVPYATARHAALYRRRVVGLVFQLFNLLPMLDVAGNVAFPLRLDGIGRRARSQRVGRILERVGLDSCGGRYPSELSGGEMQRVAIARALVTEPRVLLADEPTGSLDAVTAAGIWSLFRELVRERNVTAVVATHDAACEHSAQRVIVLEAGRIVRDSAGASRPATG